jgi:hypothetical protein
MYNKVMMKQHISIAKPEGRMSSNWQVTQYGCAFTIDIGGLT